MSIDRPDRTVLVVGGTGKTGHRVVAWRRARGVGDVVRAAAGEGVWDV